VKLFISYSRDDKNYVYELAQRLKDDTSHEVWIDRRLVAADLWWDTILDAIESCECFVTILPPKCVSSIYCAAELNYALALGKPILPLMLKPCDLPPSLRAVQTPDISGFSLDRVLLHTTQGLSKVELNLYQGKYTPPAAKSPRPLVPEPAKEEQLSDVFTEAEEVLAEGNV